MKNPKKNGKPAETAAAILLALCLIALLIGDAVKKDSEISSYTMVSAAMGSVVDITLYGGSDVTSDISRSILETENQSISRRVEGSDVFRINSGGPDVSVSDFTADVLNRTLAVCRDSGGALDITVGALSTLWDFDDNTHYIPSASEIETGLKTVGYEKVRVSGTAASVPEGTVLDLGAVGKGLACDVALECIARAGTSGAVITVGGSLLVTGENPDADCWTVGIRNPDCGQNDLCVLLQLKGTNFISTSGDYEKAFTCGGVLYHHILNPVTGCPADSGLKSVTVVAESGLLSDALSTACFVLGYADSLPLLEKYGAQAVFITDDNAVYVTDGLADALNITDSSFSLSGNNK